MSRYSLITTDTWYDQEFLELSDTEKLVWFYLLTSPLSNQAGFFKLPPKYLRVALGEKAEAALIQPSKLYKYDLATEQVLLLNYLKYNTAKSPQQLSGVRRDLRGLQPCPLFGDFILRAQRWCGEKVLEYMDKSFMTQILMLSETETDPVRKTLLRAAYDNYIDIHNSIDT